MGVEHNCVRRLKIDGSRFDINALNGGGEEKGTTRGTGHNVFGQDQDDKPISVRSNAHAW